MERRVALTHPDRVLYPDSGMTKADVARYYEAVAPVLVPHLRGRPLMLGRWPGGVHERGFGQFDCRGHPAWMTTYPLRMRNGDVFDVCVVDDEPSLAWLAQQGVIELHPYLWRADAPERPIDIVFDLDPGAPAGMRECCAVALAVRERLGAVRIDARVKTSGGSGLHVVTSADAPKRRARTIAGELMRERADLVTDHMSKEARRGRVFVDWSQNDARKQTIAPYSLRATDQPRIATPVSWDEVARGAGGASLAFSPAEVVARVRELGDLFAR